MDNVLAHRPWPIYGGVGTDRPAGTAFVTPGTDRSTPLSPPPTSKYGKPFVNCPGLEGPKTINSCRLGGHIRYDKIPMRPLGVTPRLPAGNTPPHARTNATRTDRCAFLGWGIPRHRGARLAACPRQPDAGRDGHDRRDDDGLAQCRHARGRRAGCEPLFRGLHIRRRPAERGRPNDGARPRPRSRRHRPSSKHRPPRSDICIVHRCTLLDRTVVEREAAPRDGPGSCLVCPGRRLCPHTAMGAPARMGLYRYFDHSSARWSGRYGRSSSVLARSVSMRRPIGALCWGIAAAMRWGFPAQALRQRFPAFSWYWPLASSQVSRRHSGGFACSPRISPWIGHACARFGALVYQWPQRSVSK